MKKLLLISLLLVQSVSAVTNWVNCDFLSISNALVTVNEGDWIQVKPGSCVWSNTVTLLNNKSFTFRGKSSNETTLIAGPIATCLSVQTKSTNLLTISDFNMIGNISQSSGFIFIGRNIPFTPQDWGPTRLTRLKMTNDIYRAISMGAGGFYIGLTDHCDIRTVSGASANPFTFWGNSMNSWTNTNTFFGTTNTWVCEDSYLKAIDPGNGFWDMYDGASGCVRHCVMDGNANTGGHGYDSDITGMRLFECYANSWINQINYPSMAYRAGTVLVFSNLFSGTGTSTASSPQLQYYRAADGTYVGGLGYVGYYKTNYLVGLTASGGSINTLVDNDIYGTYNLPSASSLGWLLHITGGTGAGQIRQISKVTCSGGTTGGTTTFTVSTNWTTAPDATSIYNREYASGATYNAAGHQPYYVIETPLGTASRHVLLGATISDTISNLAAAIHREPAYAGILYSAATTNVANRNTDFDVAYYDSNQIVLTNFLDGTGTFLGGTHGGWPAAFQNGVYSMQKFTNSGVLRFPCYSWENYFNVTNRIGWVPTYGDPSFYPFYPNAFLTNFTQYFLQSGRDYYTDTDTNWVAPPVGYTPLVYPHPLNINATNYDMTINSSGGFPNIATTPDFYTGTTTIAGSGVADYYHGQPVNLVADSSAGGLPFFEWQRNGTHYSSTNNISFIADSPYTFTAVYALSPSTATFNITGKVIMTGKVFAQ